MALSYQQKYFYQRLKKKVVRLVVQKNPKLKHLKKCQNLNIL